LMVAMLKIRSASKSHNGKSVIQWLFTAILTNHGLCIIKGIFKWLTLRYIFVLTVHQNNLSKVGLSSENTLFPRYHSYISISGIRHIWIKWLRFKYLYERHVLKR
jgi:hypothetical protein